MMDTRKSKEWDWQQSIFYLLFDYFFIEEYF